MNKVEVVLANVESLNSSEGQEVSKNEKKNIL